MVPLNCVRLDSVSIPKCSSMPYKAIINRKPSIDSLPYKAIINHKPSKTSGHPYYCWHASRRQSWPPFPRELPARQALGIWLGQGFEGFRFRWCFGEKMASVFRV